MKLMIDASLQSVGGGVQVAVNFINNILKDKFIDNLLIIVSPQVDEQIDVSLKPKTNYYVFQNSSSFLKFKQGKELSELEKKFNPDLVFIVFGPSYWKPKAKSIQGFALPLMVYGETVNKLHAKNLMKKLRINLLHYMRKLQIKNNFDHVVVETNTFKSLVKSNFNIEENKIFVVENSFNNNFNTNENFNLVSKKQKYNFFVPTAYYPHKNLERLVDVAYILKEKYSLYITFNFLLAKDSSAWGKILTLAEHKNVQKFFNTYGPVRNDKMCEFYQENDCVILPTIAEVSSAVYPETFVSKKLLFTSDLDFARELCGNAAVFFDPFSPEDIANKIFNVLNDLTLQEQLLKSSENQLLNQYISPEEKWEKQKKLILSLINS
ncbi:glycosyltransferase [Acinetobacter haemolyticus]|uniref:glycosyltransferase n=1 Tax=Acinetobacter haemolyticus TaxID=29430 RepID=UPI001331CEEE|nr:glycosyltransferase [Acinetobacter haemolyticus]QHI24465.1 glycosyltransferase [Acinetobacter haemolyticus]